MTGYHHRSVWLATMLLVLSGCSDMAYYGQAVSGQWGLWSQRRPVDEVLIDANVSPSLRQRLESARALREFASTELALPDNGSYRTYADLQRPYVVWNVFAAPEFSLKPRQWCFPLVGCVSYRGYFKEADALVLANELRAEGKDVYVAGIPAYSTLGWFDDPLLNTFIHWPAGRLAELVFHELAHQRLYIAGDTKFNESFATAVGRLGARLWLDRYGTLEQRVAYDALGRRREAFMKLVLPVKTELEQLYRSEQDIAAKRTSKRRLLGELQTRYEMLKQVEWDGYGGYDRWFFRDLNNAKLAALNAYTDYVPAFEALFEQSGGNFAVFYEAVEELGKLPRAAREDRLRRLMGSTNAGMSCGNRYSGVPGPHPQNAGA